MAGKSSTPPDGRIDVWNFKRAAPLRAVAASPRGRGRRGHRLRKRRPRRRSEAGRGREWHLDGVFFIATGDLDSLSLTPRPQPHFPP